MFENRFYFFQNNQKNAFLTFLIEISRNAETLSQLQDNYWLQLTVSVFTLLHLQGGPKSKPQTSPNIDWFLNFFFAGTSCGKCVVKWLPHITPHLLCLTMFLMHFVLSLYCIALRNVSFCCTDIWFDLIQEHFTVIKIRKENRCRTAGTEHLAKCTIRLQETLDGAKCSSRWDSGRKSAKC